MKIFDIDDKILELEKQIRDLKAQRVAFNGLTEVQRVAELLHEKQCHWAHEDQCGWFYESWKNPGSSRRQYLEKAENMLNEMSYEQILKVIKFM